MLYQAFASAVRRVSRKLTGKNLMVEGWRGINHSYAMVNQYQLLEFVRHPGINTFHRDLPFFGPEWNTQRNASGLSEEDTLTIDSLAATPRGPVDMTYRLSYPYRIHGADAGPTYVQATSELQNVRDTDFTFGAQEARAICDSGVKIITPSNWSKRGFVDYGFKSDHVIVVPHGTDSRIYHPPSEENRSAVRRAFGLDDQHFIFLNVGGMSWNKGVDKLLLAFAQVRKKYTHVRLVLKDQSKLYNASAAKLVADMRHDHPEQFTQEVLSSIAVSTDNLSLPQLAALYGSCDAYVSPYRGEGFGLTPLEAAACGVPVAMTGGGSTDDYFHESFALKIAGELISRDGASYIEPDLDSLIEIMSRLLEKAGGEIDAKAALAYINNRFSWKHATDRLVDVFLNQTS